MKKSAYEMSDLVSCAELENLDIGAMDVLYEDGKNYLW